MFKWRILPDYVFLPIIVFIALWLGAGGVTQAYLPWLENGARKAVNVCPALALRLVEASR